jgi:hypothetical protein
MFKLFYCILLGEFVFSFGPVPAQRLLPGNPKQDAISKALELCESCCRIELRTTYQMLFIIAPPYNIE